ncbi:L-lactate transport [Desulforamulus reducens MI-1]|uniref:L-lactate permease n=2 Tax=Desulforamulus TaxID=2916693 RepID=A4J6K1_DESRM|nr:L-lactate transport [Desulforamulus reducens MI-1]
MMWEQIITPFENQYLSAFVASIPISFLFFTLYSRVRIHIAGFLTLLVTTGVAIFVYGMPFKLAAWSSFYGGMTGMFSIGWIMLSSLFLYKLTVKTGQIHIITWSIQSITRDHRLQCLLVALCLGAFLENLAGYSTSVAITSGILVALGFRPIYAAVLCLITSISFGFMGVPIITAGLTSDIDMMAVSQMVGRQLPILSFLLPFWLVFILAGWKGTKEVWLPILVCGISFAGVQWFAANYIFLSIVNTLAAVTTMIIMVFFLRNWQPKDVWHSQKTSSFYPNEKISFSTVLSAWLPYIIMTIFIINWSFKPVQDFLNTFTVYVAVSTLNNTIIASGKPIEVYLSLSLLSSVGTVIFISAIINAYIYKVCHKELITLLGQAVRNLFLPLVGISLIIGVSYLMNWSGMIASMANVIASANGLLPMFAPILGWLGVFITGSDVSSNTLMAKLQANTAQIVGFDPVLTVAANHSGGAVAKMISPEAIGAAASATGLNGREDDIFSYTLTHSLFFLSFLCFLTYLQAYTFKWLIPSYHKVLGITAEMVNYKIEGYKLMILMLGLVLVLALFSSKLKGKDNKQNEHTNRVKTL